MRQSGPDSVPVVQSKPLTPFKVFPLRAAAEMKSDLALHMNLRDRPRPSVFFFAFFLSLGVSLLCGRALCFKRKAQRFGASYAVETHVKTGPTGAHGVPQRRTMQTPLPNDEGITKMD